MNGLLGTLNVPVDALFSTLGRTAARGLECQWAAHKMKYFYDQLMANIKAGDLNTANVDKVTGEIVCEGLSMPHSPRWANGKLWVLNSGTGHLGTVDFETKSFVPHTFCPGFLRGLAIKGGFAAVGLSKPRYERFDGLDLQKNLEAKDSEAWCGIQVINLKTGAVQELTAEAESRRASFARATSSATSLQPSQLRSGTLIYDTHGKVIGHLGVDGKVRDGNGQIIGQVGPDGLVRSEDGTVIGSAAVSAMGDPVYDVAGRLIGTVGRDGKVRDAKGRVIGTVGPDGIVRNLKGAVIGKVVAPKPSIVIPAYDKNGHLLGTVDSDGKLRDANGHVIGEVDADGTVRNIKGDVIGKTGVNMAGAPVYDSEGHLLGTIGTNVKLRDAAGNVIGEVDANGVVVTNAFDDLGRLLRKGYPGGGIEKFGYSLNVADATGYTSEYGFELYDTSGTTEDYTYAVIGEPKRE